MQRCAIIIVLYNNFSFVMVHCLICNKDFASGNSLRSHRSRYHRQSDTNAKDSTESEENIQSSRFRRMNTDEKSQDSTEEKSQSSRHVEETTNEEDDEPHRDTLSSKSKRRRRNEFNINIVNAAKYPNLIHMLCKCILEGDIPMTKEQKKILKAEADIIRQIADAGEIQRQKLIRQQIRIHDKTGDSIVAKLIEVATTAIETLFYFQ